MALTIRWRWMRRSRYQFGAHGARAVAAMKQRGSRREGKQGLAVDGLAQLDFAAALEAHRAALAEEARRRGVPLEQVEAEHVQRAAAMEREFHAHVAEQQRKRVHGWVEFRRGVILLLAAGVALGAVFLASRVSEAAAGAAILGFMFVFYGAQGGGLLGALMMLGGVLTFGGALAYALIVHLLRVF